MSSSPQINTLDLFDEVNGHLLALLRSLGPDDWHRPTMCSAWDVKDIAAHLLDTALRRLSLHRDSYASPHLRPGPDGLLPLLNRLNAEWTVAARRLSPSVLIHLLEWSGREVVAFFRTLDPDTPAAWAGGGWCKRAAAGNRQRPQTCRLPPLSGCRRRWPGRSGRRVVEMV
jgi:hypothetical protein